MNRFVSPIGLLRWTGAAVLASLLAILSYAGRTRSADVGFGEPSAHDTYTFLMGVGLWTAIISFTIVGVGLLVAQPSIPESERDPIDQADHWS